MTHTEFWCAVVSAISALAVRDLLEHFLRRRRARKVVRRFLEQATALERHELAIRRTYDSRGRAVRD